MSELIAMNVLLCVWHLVVCFINNVLYLSQLLFSYQLIFTETIPRYMFWVFDHHAVFHELYNASLMTIKLLIATYLLLPVLPCKGINDTYRFIYIQIQYGLSCLSVLK
jgi:hypothetical protein